MQRIKPVSATELAQIETALNPERLRRYLPAAQYDKAAAFALYQWNCALSEAFYLPLHFAEILARNAIHKALIFHLGEEWFNHSTFLTLLDHRYRAQLDEAVADERHQHGITMTHHHIVSALTFGFWQHLTTKRFDRLLWKMGINHNFPGAHHSKKRQDLYDLMESVRLWRNRIAHHRAIFDKGPTRKHQDTLELIKWVCGTTSVWVNANSRVPSIINTRP